MDACPAVAPPGAQFCSEVSVGDGKRLSPPLAADVEPAAPSARDVMVPGILPTPVNPSKQTGPTEDAGPVVRPWRAAGLAMSARKRRI